MAESWDNIFAPKLPQAEELVQRQFPQFQASRLQFLGEGWDCIAFRCDDWVFRFPRRPLGVETLENERTILPSLGHSVLMGEASSEFPYPFLGTRFQAGKPLEDYQGSRASLARDLGTWLRKLHRTPKPKGLQNDKMGKLGLEKRTEQIKRHLGKVPDWLPSKPLKTDDKVVVHGDLYCRHVYVDDAGEFLGVIDWGDVHLGHPCTDLAVAYAVFDPTDREIFWNSYGDVDPEWKLWARFRALYHSLLVRDYADKTEFKRLYLEAEDAVARCLLLNRGLDSGSSSPERIN